MVECTEKAWCSEDMAIEELTDAEEERFLAAVAEA